MILLAFETSGPTASVALMKDGALLAEHAVHHTRTHSETVLPMAEALMAQMEIAPSMLHAIAVNLGPGSFTGVRIGICTANAMASALQIPIYGVDSLRALYQNVSFHQGRICPLIDARNESVYAAQYENGEQLQELYAGPVEEYLKNMPDHTLFLGDGTHAYGAYIKNSVKQPMIAGHAFSLSRASALCDVAKDRIEKGDPGLSFVEPLYLRPSQAERMWAQKHGEEGEAHES